MRYSPHPIILPAMMRASTNPKWEADFVRAKFNVSSREAEQAIKQVGNNPEKIMEYLKTILRAGHNT